MGMGSLTLACVLVMANAGAEPDTVYLNATRMKIPIQINPLERDNVAEVVLWCSANEGKTWDIVDKASKADKTEFAFTAPRDGKYWFVSQTVSKKGDRSPQDPAAGVVGQKIVIDTVKPQVKITKAERKGEDIEVSWEVTEENPDATTFVVEYHPADAPSFQQWTPVPATAGAKGSTVIRSAPTSAVVVQVRVRDKANNEGVGAADVAAVEVPPPPPPPSQPSLPPAFQPVKSAPGAGSSQFTTAGLTTTTPPLHGALPAKQLINKAEVKLDFDVNNLGPSGFGTVEVYVTTDEGGHLSPLTLNPEAIQAPEMRGPGQARGSVLVHVPDDEKVFGYYLVVKSRANLGKERPGPGTLPQIRLERDTMFHTGEFKGVTPDPTRHDTLIIRWAANDKNLTDKPISLEWSPRADGPWEFIGASELPNTGSYAWQVPPSAAAATSVYLKLTVRDGAGNVFVSQLKEPQIVDMNIPEVDGVSVSPNR